MMPDEPDDPKNLPMPGEPPDLRLGEELLIEASKQMAQTMIDGLIRLHYQTLGFLMAQVVDVTPEMEDEEEEEDEE